MRLLVKSLFTFNCGSIIKVKKKTSKHFKLTVNDAVERGVNLIEESNNYLIKNEEQLQYIL